VAIVQEFWFCNLCGVQPGRGFGEFFLIHFFYTTSYGQDLKVVFGSAERNAAD
jgi:hypothetical protein